MKKITYAVLVILAMSCNNQTSDSREEKNVELVKAMFEAFNQHDWQKMASYYADNAQFLDPSLGKAYITKSRNQIAKKYSEMSGQMANLHDEVIGIYPSNNKVFVEFISTATLPDGLNFSLPIATVLTIENNLIVKDATYYDN